MESKGTIKNLLASASCESSLAAHSAHAAILIHHYGLKSIASKLKGYSKDFLGWRKEFLKRALQLGGKTRFETEPAEAHETIVTAIQHLHDSVKAKVDEFNEYAVQAMHAKDDTSRNMWEHALKDHEDKLDKLARLLNQVSTLGEKSVLLQHIR